MAVSRPLTALALLLAVCTASSCASVIARAGNGVNAQAAANLLHLGSTMLQQVQSTEGIDYATIHADVEELAREAMTLLMSLPSSEGALASGLQTLLDAAWAMKTISDDDRVSMSQGLGELLDAVLNVLPSLQELVPASQSAAAVMVPGPESGREGRHQSGGSELPIGACVPAMPWDAFVPARKYHRLQQ